MKRYVWLVVLVLALSSAACSANPVEIVDENTQSADGGNTTADTNSSNANDDAPAGETGQVVRVVDGDTINVLVNGEELRVRYLGMNTTEITSSEPCSDEGRRANAALVENRTVTLVADEEDEDRFGRKLRYVFVGNTHVNAELVRQGWAEAVLYEPNSLYWEEFVALEEAAARAGRGCHGISGIFNDGSNTR